MTFPPPTWGHAHWLRHLANVGARRQHHGGCAQVLGNQLYGPYGNLRYTAGTIGTTRGFTGQYNDGLTGLDYYGARSYDPLVGRFISADEVEGNLQAADPSAYVNGNPETDTDPTGEFIYDLVTGQAAIPSPTPGVAPTVVQWNAPVAYLPPPPPVRPKTPASVKPAHKTAAVANAVGKGLLKAASQASSCNGGGIAQVFCSNSIANYAIHGPGGAAFSMPGLFNLESGQGGGGGSHDHGGAEPL